MRFDNLQMPIALKFKIRVYITTTKLKKYSLLSEITTIT